MKRKTKTSLISNYTLKKSCCVKKEFIATLINKDIVYEKVQNFINNLIIGAFISLDEIPIITPEGEYKINYIVTYKEYKDT
jgi:hypothetical protein